MKHTLSTLQNAPLAIRISVLLALLASLWGLMVLFHEIMVYLGVRNNLLTQG